MLFWFPISTFQIHQGLSSVRRFSVGRSSSELGSAVVCGEVFCLSVCSVRVRNVGLPGPLSIALRANITLRRRAFTESNSDEVTIYSGRAGRILAISFCVFSMRSWVGG